MSFDDSIFNDLLNGIKNTRFLSEDETNKVNSSEDESELQNSQQFEQYKANIQDVTQSQSANMNGKTVEEILNLSNKNEGLGYSYNSLEHYSVDIDIYEDIVNQSPIMQETLLEGESLLPTFKYLHQDIFLSLYKYTPTVLPKSEMHKSTLLNRAIIGNLVNTPDYITLRSICRLDLFNAALGTEIMGKKVIEVLQEAIKNIKDLEKKKEAMDKLLEEEEKIDEIIEEIENIDELIEDAKRCGNTAYANQLQADKADRELSIATLKAMANKIAEECDELIEASDEFTDEFVNTVSADINDMAEEVKEVSDICNSWGLGEGATCNVAFQSKKQAIERIRRSDKLKKFTDLIGKFKECAVTEQKKKAKHGAVEIKSVTTGNKIQDSLPSDRMSLCNNTTKKDFYRRMTENQLMTYRKESTKQKNKGPIIVCVDTSGSMHGNPETWSKALTVGILEVAQMQKRDFACIIYSSTADDPIIIKKDEVSPEKILDCAERFHSGGTSFERPLEKAIELIKDSRFKDADIVFITDGDCYVSDKFLKKFKQTKEDKEFKTLGVLVDVDSYSSESSLKEFCDSITLVSNIADLKNSESDVNKSIFGAL